MTRRFTVHELRPLRDADAKAPAPAARSQKLGKADRPAPAGKPVAPGKSKETGGPSGPEPTRYGDWERNGICVDF